MNEYRYSDSMFGLVAAMSVIDINRSVYDDLGDIRRVIGPKRVAKRRDRIVRSTKTTHQRNRAKVSAQRKANVRRLQSRAAA